MDIKKIAQNKLNKRVNNNIFMLSVTKITEDTITIKIKLSESLTLKPIVDIWKITTDVIGNEYIEEYKKHHTEFLVLNYNEKTIFEWLNKLVIRYHSIKVPFPTIPDHIYVRDYIKEKK